jgi:hypothetical protein
MGVDARRERRAPPSLQRLWLDRRDLSHGAARFGCLMAFWIQVTTSGSRQVAVSLLKPPCGGFRSETVVQKRNGHTFTTALARCNGHSPTDTHKLPLGCSGRMHVLTADGRGRWWKSTVWFCSGVGIFK